MQVQLDGNLTSKETHRIALDIEREVKKAIPNARVTIDTEPFGNGRENIWKLVKDIAENAPGSRGVHPSPGQLLATPSTHGRNVSFPSRRRQGVLL